MTPTPRSDMTRRKMKDAFNGIPSLDEIIGFVGAARMGEMKWLQAYLDKYPAIINKKDDMEETALMWAARVGRKDIVAFLLERGASLDEKSRFGQTALEMAKRWGNADAALLLEQWPGILKQRAKARELAEEIATFSPALKRDLPRPRPLKLSPRRL